jgi:hypothetical protein
MCSVLVSSSRTMPSVQPHTMCESLMLSEVQPCTCRCMVRSTARCSLRRTTVPAPQGHAGTVHNHTTHRLHHTMCYQRMLRSTCIAARCLTHMPQRQICWTCGRPGRPRDPQAALLSTHTRLLHQCTQCLHVVPNTLLRLRDALQNLMSENQNNARMYTTRAPQGASYACCLL